MLGTLYLVATPIGNPDDISFRALRILREVERIAAEDARVTRRLLDYFQIAGDIVTYPARSQGEGLASLLDLLRAGRDLAYVCDAGTPGIADPGRELLLAAIRIGAGVAAVPGPVAAIAALMVSGLPAGRFAFDGFPPRARADRAAFFAGLAREPRTLLLYESPAYLPRTLADLARALGPARSLVLARDLTKRAETVFRGTLAEAAARFRSHPPRGEYALVLAPPANPAKLPIIPCPTSAHNAEQRDGTDLSRSDESASV
jgi:16S rRNA (cytidine1402-2'-O)-methyltransferase